MTCIASRTESALVKETSGWSGRSKEGDKKVWLKYSGGLEATRCSRTFEAVTIRTAEPVGVRSTRWMLEARSGTRSRRVVVDLNWWQGFFPDISRISRCSSRVAEVYEGPRAPMVCRDMGDGHSLQTSETGTFPVPLNKRIICPRLSLEVVSTSVEGKEAACRTKSRKTFRSEN